MIMLRRYQCKGTHRRRTQGKLHDQAATTAGIHRGQRLPAHAALAAHSTHDAWCAGRSRGLKMLKAGWPPTGQPSLSYQVNALGRCSCIASTRCVDTCDT